MAVAEGDEYGVCVIVGRLQRPVGRGVIVLGFRSLLLTAPQALILVAVGD